MFIIMSITLYDLLILCLDLIRASELKFILSINKHEMLTLLYLTANIKLSSPNQSTGEELRKQCSKLPRNPQACI